ncbi:hypothetical protein [Erythrobacter sp. CCH5-A1]|jgi:hypothetical protein|uniref:hypothetical protein n=1 Tax=Erythrobacter sp. CCH5-A1 TaxID=1768792 RepID=UPI00082AA8B8|nr:hypothetical protein [Erythrobacter sp. CCH5-A1]
MSSRISSASLALGLLAGCGGTSPEPPGDEIECAIGAGAQFAFVCTIERVAGAQEIILHHPDGGFRRMTFDPSSGALAPLDGSDPVVLEPALGVVQFAVGQDRYRISREPPDAPTP